jgi:hypothetical protein
MTETVTSPRWHPVFGVYVTALLATVAFIVMPGDEFGLIAISILVAIGTGIGLIVELRQDRSGTPWLRAIAWLSTLCLVPIGLLIAGFVFLILSIANGGLG